MVSDNKLLYVGLRNGKIISLPVDNIDVSNLKIVKNQDRRYPITLLKLSRDNSFLVAYVDVEGKE